MVNFTDCKIKDISLEYNATTVQLLWKKPKGKVDNGVLFLHDNTPKTQE